MIRFGLMVWAFLVFLEVLGARPCVAVLSGTVVGGPATVTLGLMYAVTFLAAVVVAPPFVATGLITFVHARVRRSLRAANQTS